jgi:hypothetical protein
MSGTRRQEYLRLIAMAAGAAAAAAVLLALRQTTGALATVPDGRRVVMFCVFWIALYPIARHSMQGPGWAHWARGGFVLLVLWGLTRWMH